MGALCFFLIGMFSPTFNGVANVPPRISRGMERIRTRRLPAGTTPPRQHVAAMKRKPGSAPTRYREGPSNYLGDSNANVTYSWWRRIYVDGTINFEDDGIQLGADCACRILLFDMGKDATTPNGYTIFQRPETELGCPFLMDPNDPYSWSENSAYRLNSKCMDRLFADDEWARAGACYSTWKKKSFMRSRPKGSNGTIRPRARCPHSDHVSHRWLHYHSNNASRTRDGSDDTSSWGPTAMLLPLFMTLPWRAGYLS